MAEMTGGVDIVNTNNFKGNYAKVARPTGPTYILTYSSPASQSDGRFHRIGVAVDRPDVTVQSKQGLLRIPSGRHGHTGDAAAAWTVGSGGGSSLKTSRHVLASASLCQRLLSTTNYRALPSLSGSISIRPS